MADDGLTTAHEFIKLLTDARDNCNRVLARAEKPKDNDGNYLETYCHGEWDKISCWPNSPPGQAVSIDCPDYVVDFDHSGKARRYCNVFGKWAKTESGNQTWSDYGACPSGNIEEAQNATTKPEELSMIQLYTVGYSFSLVSLIIAVIILGYFKRLHCTRNYIHMHLFVSFILRAAIIFVKDQVLFYGSGIFDVSTSSGSASDALNAYLNATMLQGGARMIKCNIVMTLFHYFVATNYYWILVEALYLHSLIFVAFFSDKKYLWRFIITGWGVPVLFVVPWAIVRAAVDSDSCWDVAVKEYKWIYNGPILVASLINFLLFLNIIRVLWYKMKERSGRSDNRRQYKKLAKSTLVLIPMFGVHAIVFIAMPDHVEDGTWWYIRMYFDLFFNSFQGFFVAIIYCFCNGEVQGEFKKAWERFNLSVEIQRGRRDRSRSSVTMLTSFSSSASPQGRLSIGGPGNCKSVGHRHNGALLTRTYQPNCDLKDNMTSQTADAETSSADVDNENNNHNASQAPQEPQEEMVPLFRSRDQTHTVGDVILPIAEELVGGGGGLEEEFERAVEMIADQQIQCPAESFNVNNDGKINDDDVIGHDENIVTWQRHRSRGKRAESEDSGISSNFISSFRRGSGGVPKTGNSSMCDSAASGSESEGCPDNKVAVLSHNDVMVKEEI